MVPAPANTDTASRIIRPRPIGRGEFTGSFDLDAPLHDIRNPACAAARGKTARSAARRTPAERLESGDANPERLVVRARARSHVRQGDAAKASELRAQAKARTAR